MFRYLFETARKHLLVKLSLGLVLVAAVSIGVELAYRSRTLQAAWEGYNEQQARSMSRNLSLAIARPLFEGNRDAVDSALRVLGAGEGFSGGLVIDADGRDVAMVGSRRFTPGEAVVASRGVDYEDEQGNKIPVGAVVVALDRQGAKPWWREEISAALARSTAIALLILVATLILARRLCHPLRGIGKALHQLARGETDTLLMGADRVDEIGQLSSAMRSLREAIRSRQRVEEGLRSLLAEKSEMLDQAPIGILTERQGVIVACNTGLERIFGYLPGELLGRLCKTLYVSDVAFARINAEAGQERRRGKPFSGEAELHRKNGQPFLGAMSTAAARTLDGAAYNTWLYSDISNTKRVEADMFEVRIRLEKLVAERTRQLEEARQKAACVSASADVSGGDLSNESRRPAHADVEMLPFDPASVVEGVAALSAPLVEEKGLELVLEIDSRLPSALLGDPFRIGQTLTTLLSNAIRLTKQGEVVLVVREAGCGHERLRLEFRVRHQSIGVTRGQQDGRFKSDHQPGDVFTVRRPEGRSHALAISKRLVESMGGTLGLESEYGEGNTFHFTVDFEVVEQAKDKAESYAEQLRAQAGNRVMVIDDSHAARMATASLLSRLGFVPVLFESGWMALDSLARSGAPNYLFICIDRRMPELDGLEVARRLHAHYRGACPPLILLTAFSHAAELQGAVHGFSALVSKPLTIDRLFSHVAVVLGVPVASPETKPAPCLKGKRVLLVKSDGMHQEIVAEFLREAGLTVRIARDGLEALQAVREEVPDCVLQDCRMLDMDARELTGRLRLLGYGQLPIIGLSAGTRSADVASFLAAGMSELVAKPVDLPVLLGVLAKWLAPPIRGVAAADGNALPPLPPELDVESGLRHLHGKTALFLRALRMFRDSCGRQFQLEFSSAVRARDWQTSERLAHSLKGTAATIGANQVSAAAARLEAAIRSSNYTEANALLAELTEKLQVLVEGLAHIG